MENEVLDKKFIDELFKLTLKAKKNTYSPYSHFGVGACLITKDGKSFLGANIENSSFGLTCCAERNAIFATYSNGYKKEDIKALGIVCDCLKGKYCSPCGACRQVINDLLDKNTPIVLFNQYGEYKIVYKNELLPFGFTSEDLI